jgi:hypothetical protein
MPKQKDRSGIPGMSSTESTLLHIDRLFTFDDLVAHYGGPRSLWEKWRGILPVLTVQDGIAIYLESKVDKFLKDVEQRLQTGSITKPMPLPKEEAGGSGQYSSSGEMPTRAAAEYLSVSADTLEKYVSGGLLARRNISPSGSGKPRYRYRIADLDRLKSESYRKMVPRQAPARRRRSQGEAQVYEGLDL